MYNLWRDVIKLEMNESCKEGYSEKLMSKGTDGIKCDKIYLELKSGLINDIEICVTSWTSF